MNRRHVRIGLLLVGIFLSFVNDSPRTGWGLVSDSPKTGWGLVAFIGDVARTQPIGG